MLPSFVIEIANNYISFVRERGEKMCVCVCVAIVDMLKSNGADFSMSLNIQLKGYING